MYLDCFIFTKPYFLRKYSLKEGLLTHFLIPIPEKIKKEVSLRSK